MITKIFKQIWNQRRMNGWIFIEVIIAGFFLWTVIDPMYVLMTNHFEPKGYEEDGRYVLQLGAYGQSHGKRDTTITNEQSKQAFLRLMKMVCEQPEVESAYLAMNRSLPNSMSWSGGQYYPDTLAYNEDKYIHAQQFSMLTGNEFNMFRTLGMKDVRTGKPLDIPEDAAARNLCFISELFAQKMFGTTEVIGQKIYQSKKRFYEVGGVFKDIQTRDYFATYPLIVFLQKDIRINDFTHRGNNLIFHLKDGVDFDTFNERFKKEVAPHMKQGNFYFDSFRTLTDVRHELGTMFGNYNTLRLKTSLAIFTLLCIFLGMVGTFWIRCNARRQEIGLMRSMGATEARVKKQFLAEAALLVTAAFVFSLVLVVNFVVMADGMSQQNVSGETSFALVSSWLSPGVQFAMVSLITYLALLVIALAGTLIPVRRAVKVLPADALRDE